MPDRNQIIQGDALEVLRTLKTHSVDAIVTDPPAGISITNMRWDSNKGGRDKWIAWLAEILAEARRVIKPGGHAFVWALPRTAHWTATALENSGWQIRDKMYHLFGSGYPKSHDLARVIERLAGAEAAMPYAGWGTCVKPAVEEWILARAPLAESTIAANVLSHGTGGINVDACRVPRSGRWPANLLLSHSFLCDEEHCESDCPVFALDQRSVYRKGHIRVAKAGTIKRSNVFGNQTVKIDKFEGYNDVGRASRFFHRFYYSGKASKAERNEGCEGLPAKSPLDFNGSGIDGRGQPYETTPNGNHHPTVKNLSLMQFLVRMTVPKGGTCLDMFAGSGSTLVACVYEGFDFLGIEQSPEYVQIANARVQHALSQVEVV